MIGSSKKLVAFLCHSSRDKPAVRELYSRLFTSGVDPWLDEKNILPGQDWDLEIRKEVRKSDVVLVCFSRSSVSKAGYLQKEMRLALDAAAEQPEGTIFLIPVRLEECDIPASFKHLHCANLFEEVGYERLMESLRLRARDVGAVVSATGRASTDEHSKGQEPLTQSIQSELTKSQTVPEAFFQFMTSKLHECVGPMAPLIIGDVMTSLGESRNGFPKGRLPDLVDRLSEDIVSEELRNGFRQSIQSELIKLEASDKTQNEDWRKSKKTWWKSISRYRPD